jgi:hypothetical protein
MPATSLIQTPSLENLPMIDRAFAQTNSHHDHEWYMQCWPSLIEDDLLAAYQALTPATFARLFSILQPEVRGVHVLNLQILVDCALAHRESPIEYADEAKEQEAKAQGLPDFTDQQLQVFLLQRAIYPPHIDWRKVADVMNAATCDQQSAIDRFFLEFHRTGIEALLSTKAMEFAVPSVLYSNNEVSQDGEEIFVYCKVANTWMREDAFYCQFEVSARDLFTSELSIVGYAGTLEQAMAKASLFAMSKSSPVTHQADPFGDLNTAGGRPFTLTLRRRNSLVAVASISNMNTQLPCTLQWDVVRNGAIDEMVVKRALYAAEASLHVQWSKARDLEAAMGL